MKWIEFELGYSPTHNAGLLGLLYALEYAEGQKGKDYDYNDHILKIHTNYLTTINMPDVYIKLCVDKMGKNTQIYNLIKSLSRDRKDSDKDYKELIKNLKELLKKERYITQIQYYERDYNVKVLEKIQNIIEILDSDKNTYNKEKCIELKDVLCDKNLFEYLAMDDIRVNQFQSFFRQIAFIGKAGKGKHIKESFNKEILGYFLKYINNEDEFEENKKTNYFECCGCKKIFHHKTKDYKCNLGFIDEVDNSEEKNSVFWNYDNISYICPQCRFLYMFIPLAFSYVGLDCFFINVNTSIENLIKMNRSKESILTEKDSIKSYLFEKITVGTLETYINSPGIQIDLRTVIGSGQKRKFIREEYIIDSNLITLFSNEKRSFSNLSGKYIVYNKEYINIYDKLIDYLLYGRTLYDLIDFLYLNSLRENNNAQNLINLLNIEVGRKLIKGENNMNDLNEIKNKAYQHGKMMRKTLLKETGSKDTDLDNKFRSKLYALSSAARSGNSKQFVDLIINLYSSYGLQIPKLFLYCLDDNELFGIIARAYLIGLKSYDKIEKGENENE